MISEEEKIKTIMPREMLDKLLEDHSRRIISVEGRISKLEIDTIELKTELKNICKEIHTLSTILKWFITVIVGAIISIFFYGIQNTFF